MCIPTCDGEQYVAEAIESVLAQTFEDFELLVVDDRSSDRTLEIVRSYRDPRIQLHQNDERLGIARNWNRGLELARGEFFCLFHQDDVMLVENLQHKVRLLEADPYVGFVHSSVEFVTELAAPPGSSHWVEDATEDFVIAGRRYFRTMILSGNRVCAPAVVARRQVLVDVGRFNESLAFALDYELWLKVCVNWHVGFLSRPLVRYRWHQRNASHAFPTGAALDEAVSAATSALAFYADRGGDPNEREVLEEAVATIDRERRWAAELAAARAWLSEQSTGWRDKAEQRESTIVELQGWIDELEKAKTWLSEQSTNWKNLAEQREVMILELRHWAEELEKARTWQTEQTAHWRRVAENGEAAPREQQAGIERLERQKDSHS